MTHPIARTLTLANDADADGIAQSQTPLAAGNLTLNGALVSGGVATFATPRRVQITSAADESARTFTVYGTARVEQGGISISEAVTGANIGAAYTTQDFATVTRIAVDAATAGAVTAGTNDVSSDAWVPWDTNNINGPDFSVRAIGQVMSGSPTWQVDYTLDDVYGLWLPSSVPFPRAIPFVDLQGKTGTADANLPGPIKASRLTLVAPGSVQLTQIQQGS